MDAKSSQAEDVFCEEGEPRPVTGVGEPLWFPRGSEARTPTGRPARGQQPPRFGDHGSPPGDDMSPGRGRTFSGGRTRGVS